MFQLITMEHVYDNAEQKCLSLYCQARLDGEDRREGQDLWQQSRVEESGRGGGATRHSITGLQAGGLRQRNGGTSQPERLPASSTQASMQHKGEGRSSRSSNLDGRLLDPLLHLVSSK